MNGTSPSKQSDINKDFIQLWIENIDDTSQRTNLTPTALIQYNNTEIQCRTIVIGRQVLSDYATLLVQSKAIINKLSVNNVLIICSQVYYCYVNFIVVFSDYPDFIVQC